MKKLSLFLLLCSFWALGQTYQITYKNFFEGKEVENADPMILYANAENAYVVSQDIVSQKKVAPYEVIKFDNKTSSAQFFAFLKNNQVSTYTDPEVVEKYNFLEVTGKYNIEQNKETKKILGYNCHKATAIVKSNKMEVWYTNDLKIKGGPSTIGANLGLVLEIVRNGSSSTKAVSVKKIKNFNSDALFKNKKIETTDELTYRDLLWRNRFNTLPIFDNETINFSDQSKSDEKIMRYANGTIILKKIKFPEIPQGNEIFAELHQQSNGDAYDRTGSVFVITQEREKSFFDALSKNIEAVPAYDNGNGKVYRGMALTQDYVPALELMRFYTPFGIHYFNTVKIKNRDWHDTTAYRQDITELRPSLSGKELWVGSYIGNYDKGGHKVSLEITIHDDTQNVHKNNFVLPLFNTVNIMEMANQEYATLFSSEKGLEVSFNLKKDLKNAQLRYITTGHGGWENGDEFVPKANTISLDGTQVMSFVPWRTDCGSYRLYNPASGNFGNGLSSSDYSRSNWCPGTTTNPQYISLGDLKAGNHTIKIHIPLGKNEGNSFSYWNVSGALLGNE